MDPTGPFGAYGANDPLFLLLAALALEAYAGDFVARLPKVRHPRAWTARLTGRLELRLNRPQRGRRALVIRGLLVTLAVAGGAALVGWALALLTRPVPYLWVVELLLLAALLGQRPVVVRLKQVAAALDTGSGERARAALRPLAGERLDPTQLERLDSTGCAVAALDGAARRAVSAAIAPVFWYVLLGLPGICLQQAAHTAATVLATGNRPGGGGLDPAREGDFALTAVRLDQALDWLPDKLAGLGFALAAVFVPEARPLFAVRRLLRARSWAVGALGGALALAGRRDGTLSRLGAPAAGQLRRAALLVAVALLLQAAGVALLVLARQQS
jgi:adenosylcobinamide-phosphate synthase